MESPPGGFYDNGWIAKQSILYYIYIYIRVERKTSKRKMDSFISGPLNPCSDVGILGLNMIHMAL